MVRLRSTCAWLVVRANTAIVWVHHQPPLVKIVQQVPTALCKLLKIALSVSVVLQVLLAVFQVPLTLAIARYAQWVNTVHNWQPQTVLLV